MFGVAVGPLSGAILSLPAQVLKAGQRSVGFGVFYTLFYVLMAVGPSLVGRLQDFWQSPSAGLIAAAALLVVAVPLSLSFASLANRRQIADHSLETEWRAAS
jgi:MFS family permease